MSEAQQGPEICDVISAKRNISYFILTVGASVGEREVFGSAKSFFQTYSYDRILFSIFLQCM